MSHHTKRLPSGFCQEAGLFIIVTALVVDATTGLPVPTIVVGTAGGVSVIKNDGTHHSLLNNSNSQHCDRK